MPSVVQAVLASWSFPPVVTALNLLTALLYIRGWIELRAAMPDRFTPWRLACFLGGIADAADRARLSHRHVRSVPPHRPHAPAHAPDDDRAAARAAGRSADSVAARPAALGRAQRARPVPELARARTPRRSADRIRRSRCSCCRSRWSAGTFRRPTNSRCALPAGTKSSTPAFSSRRCSSGGP